MCTARGMLLIVSLVLGMGFGAPVALSGVDAPVATAALPLFVDDAAAFQLIDVPIDIDVNGEDGEDCGVLSIVCNASDSDSGDGGNGGRGGIATVHDVGNAHADASNSVIIDDVTTGPASGHNVEVDAAGATDPVVVVVAGSFSDTGVDVFAPSGSSQAGTTGGDGVTADASGGAGGNAGNNNSCSAALGCLDLNLDLKLALEAAVDALE